LKSNGITWSADYVAVANLDETQMGFEGFVRVSNNYLPIDKKDCSNCGGDDGCDNSNYYIRMLDKDYTNYSNYYNHKIDKDSN